jgi:NodT family efflux transporter outer membrane factor (OMF) lipoprotein
MNPSRLRLRSSLATALAVPLLLAGCMVGPDYVRPAAPVPAQYKEADGWKTAQPADDAPRGAWWEAYQDPELNALITQVDVSNQTIAAAAARVREAGAATQATRAALYPVVNAGGSAVRNDSGSGSSSSSRSGGANSAYNVLLGASWEPDLWGGIRRSIEAASGTAQASEADLANARLSMQAQLAQTYLLLRVQDAQVALLTTTAKGYERSLELTQNQYAAGIVARGDVTQAEAQLKSTQAQVIDAQLARAQLEHGIAVLIGKPPSELAIAPRATLTAVYPDVPLAVPSALLERRPDIAAAERRAAAANAQIGVAQAAFFPALTLSANGGLQSSVIGSLLSLPTHYWSLGASLLQPLFDAGLRSAQKDQAIAKYDETVANYRATVLNGFQEVEDNLAALTLLAREAMVQNDAVKASQQSAAIAMNQYRAGTASFLAVVVLQANALNSERTALAITGRRLTASVDLVRALGGGWNAAALASAQP